MNNINKFILSVSILLGVLSNTNTFAQSNNKKIVNKKVEVTKDYIPTVEKAIKRDITPAVEENIVIDVPALKYNISFKPEKYPFKINYIEIPQLQMGELEPIYKGYADIMLGGPLSTRGFVSYTTERQRNTIAGISLSHNGFWGKLENEMGENLSAQTTTNDLSIFFEYFKDKLKAKISATQRFDLYNRYGYNFYDEPVAETFDFEGDAFKQRYSKTSIYGEIGTPFENIESLNGKFYASVNIMSDKFGFSESIYHAGMLISKGLKNINSIVQGRVEYLSVVPSRKFTLYFPYASLAESLPGITEEDIAGIKYSPTGILSIAPRYIFDYKKLNIDLGVKAIFNIDGKAKNYKQGGTVLIPDAKVAFNFSSGAVKPYVELNGDYINNNYFSLTEQNPYVMEGLTAPNSTIRRYLLGVEGSVGSSFLYKAYGGLRQSKDMLMFIGIEGGNITSSISDNFENFELGVELGYLVNSKLNFKLDATYIDYNKSGGYDLDKAFGYANFKANFGVTYIASEKLNLNLNANYTSDRTFLYIYTPIVDYINIDPQFTKVKSVVNLSLGGQYSVTERIGVSLNVDNLLNKKLYPYMNYRGVGLNILAGVSYRF